MIKKNCLWCLTDHHTQCVPYTKKVRLFIQKSRYCSNRYFRVGKRRPRYYYKNWLLHDKLLLKFIACNRGATKQDMLLFASLQYIKWIEKYKLPVGIVSQRFMPQPYSSLPLRHSEMPSHLRVTSLEQACLAEFSGE